MPYPHKRATNYTDAAIFHFYFSPTLLWRSGIRAGERANEWVSECVSGPAGRARSWFTSLPSRTLGHNTLLLMIVARIKLVTSQLETCTDGNFWLLTGAAAPGPRQQHSCSVCTKMTLRRDFIFFFKLLSFTPCYEFKGGKNKLKKKL